MNNPTLRFARLNPNAVAPTRRTPGSAGLDLSASDPAVVPARGSSLVNTGLAVELPPGCYGRIAPRSGLAVQFQLDVGAGVIDPVCTLVRMGMSACERACENACNVRASVYAHTC